MTGDHRHSMKHLLRRFLALHSHIGEPVRLEAAGWMSGHTIGEPVSLEAAGWMSGHNIGEPVSLATAGWMSGVR